MLIVCINVHGSCTESTEAHFYNKTLGIHQIRWVICQNREVFTKFDGLFVKIVRYNLMFLENDNKFVRKLLHVFAKLMHVFEN